ncbi:MAG: Ig-like domain-containing protein, partial [Burkholderiaceae bacterium]|nr:Ig-like domain-containing protein [Burkholderiaceae bacterium]
MPTNTAISQTALANDLSAVVASVISAATASVQSAMQQTIPGSSDANALAAGLQVVTSYVESRAQAAAQQIVGNAYGPISEDALTQDLNSLVAAVINACSIGLQNVASQYATGSSTAQAVVHGLQIVIPNIITAASATAQGIINNAHPSDQTTPSEAITGAIAVNFDGGITVAGNAQAFSKVHVTFPDGSTGIVTTDGQGHYSVTTHAPQTSGEIQVAATDSSSGQPEGAPIDIVYTGSTPPQTPIISNVTGNIDGGITVTGTAAASNTVQVIYPDGSTATITAEANGHYSLTTHTPQPTGIVDVISTDSAGHISQPADLSYTAIPIIVFTDISPDTNSQSDFVTSANHLIFEGKLSIPLAPGEQVQVGGSGGWLTAQVNGTTWSYDDTANTAIPDG